MPKQKRFKTKYPGVTYIVGTGADGKPENVYMIRYYKDGKQIEERAGRARKDDMTAAKASLIRVDRIQGDTLPNQEKRQAAIAAEKRAKDEEDKKQTIAKLWRAYKENKPALKGIVTDENRYKNHLEPVFGDREPHAILPLDVDRLRLKMMKTHKPATVRNTLELFRRIINFGVKKNLCAGLSFKIEFPPVDNLTTEDLTADQLQNFLKALDETEYKTAAVMLKMALYTGMRRGELFRMKFSDLNFEKGLIFIRDPKGGQGQSIPMNDAARAMLESIPRKKIKTENKDEILYSEFVFPGKGGQQRVDIIKSANKIKAEAGLPANFRPFHGLRHVFASTLASSGQVDMYVLQRLLTHKSGVMTQRYAHLRDEILRSASYLAGEIIGVTMKKSDDEKIIEMKNNKR